VIGWLDINANAGVMNLTQAWSAMGRAWWFMACRANLGLGGWWWWL